VAYPAIAVLSLKILSGIIGSLAAFHSIRIKMPYNNAPMLVGATVCIEFQGLEIPPDVTPTRKRVEAEVKRNRPSQSIRMIFVANDEESFLRFRQNVRPIMQITHRGL
jgi:hypothetical protein